MTVSHRKFWTFFHLIATISSLASGCNVVVAIGKEDSEISDYNAETDPDNDPLARIASQQHPVIKFQEDQAALRLTAPWAEKAIKAREAQAHISTGDYFSCAQNSAGRVKCWGYAPNGSNGKDPILEDKNNYFDEYTNTARKIAVTTSASCFITDTFKLQCHGAASQTGQTSAEDSFKPVTPATLSSARDLDSRSGNYCAITTNGTLKCWGSSFGKTPNEIAGHQERLLRVALGTGHHCVMDSDFRALCWGSNSKGQLGLDTETVTSRAAPVYVENLPQGVIQIAVGGEHTCALLESGAVKCWGSNEKGQLGNGGNENSSVPVDVVGLDSGVIAIDAGSGHSCALKEEGTVFCWGNNEKGQLGNANNEQQSTPARVTGLLSPVEQYSSGSEHNCVLTRLGEAWCWGHGNIFNQLGDGESKDSNTPVQVKNFN